MPDQARPCVDVREHGIGPYCEPGADHGQADDHRHYPPVPQDPAVESIEAAGKEVFDLGELSVEPADRAEFMTRANDICARDSKADKPINFATLANELYPEDPEALIEALADPDRGLIDGFVADRRALREGAKLPHALWRPHRKRKLRQRK